MAEPEDDAGCDFREMAQQPKFKKTFEKLLRIACKKGDVAQVRERLGWGVDPNCATPKGRTPLMVNVRGCASHAGVVRALLAAGADPSLMDITGLTALDYARRKFMKYGHRLPPPRSPSLDENGNLVLPKHEQRAIDQMRRDMGAEHVKIYLQERLKAARRVFNDPAQITRILEILEDVEEQN